MDVDFIQSGNLYRFMLPDEQKRLIENIVRSIRTAPKEIQELMLGHFTKADKNYGNEVAKGLQLI